MHTFRFETQLLSHCISIIYHMGSLETIQATSRPTEPVSGPRISFSDNFLDQKKFISIIPENKEKETGKEKFKNVEFEFLSSNLACETMLTADELFFEGKLLPFRKIHHSEKVNMVGLRTDQQKNGRGVDSVKVDIKEEPRMSWFLDDDPSPRPPTCTVLWKELLRLRKKRTSTLSPSLSTSSSSSSDSIPDVHLTDEGTNGKYLRTIKKGLERTRSAGLKIRPMVNVPVCTQEKNNASLPPLFSLKKRNLTKM